MYCDFFLDLQDCSSLFLCKSTIYVLPPSTVQLLWHQSSTMPSPTNPCQAMAVVAFVPGIPEQNTLGNTQQQLHLCEEAGGLSGILFDGHTISVNRIHLGPQSGILALQLLKEY